MKKIIYILLLPIVAIGQSTNQNYTKAVAYKEETSTSLPNPTSSQASIQVAYYDGLGRPIQQISNKQSNSGKNIVTRIEYDQYGRQVKEYLSYKSDSESLDIETNTLTNTLNYLDYVGQNPFSDKQLEASPIGRILKQSAPGTDWTMGFGHEVKFKYQTNEANEVKMYKASATWSPTLGLYEIQFVNASGTVYYDPSELYKTVTYDENNLETSQNFTVEYKNKEGKVVLKRVNTSTEIFDTYYVYDQFGNLTYVVPPLVNTNSAISSNILNGLCYQYKYDSRNRLVEKKLPGKQWEFIVYNNLNQPVATGPSYNPFGSGAQGWLITKYDVFERVTLTGWYNGIIPSSSGRLAYQVIMNGYTSPYEARLTGTTTINGLNVSYTDKVYPENAINAYTLLTVNYYDDYLYYNAPVSTSIPTSIELQSVNTLVKGMLTGSWVRVLQSGVIMGENSYTLYDSKARVIRTNKTNHLGGFTQVDTKLDFIGKTNYTTTTHRRSLSTPLITVKDEFTYNVQDRLLNHTHKINNDAVQLLARNEYNDLGKLIAKRVGGNDLTGDSSLQKIDFTYNIRGWLKEINKVNDLKISSEPQDLFAFKINYNEVEDESGYTGVKLFNGNIAETYWHTANDDKKRKYGYQYDNLNRLTNAIYQKPDANVVVTNSYNESLSYDKNGNITSLQRYGEYDDDSTQLLIDNLTYNYDSTNSNQLYEVIDDSMNPNGFKDGVVAGNDYVYDANGNMVADGNKNIENITYNHLNLPRTIDFADTNYIEYIYNALGVKVQKGVMNNEIYTTTDYLDGFQYVDEILEIFPHSEGYVKNTLIDDRYEFNYAFNYTDHLGNIRLTYGVDPLDHTLIIMEENNYYPFGLTHKNYNATKSDYGENGEGIRLNPLCSTCDGTYKYKYNGKEYQDELGLNMYDYGARNYDPALGRWMNIDPKAETSRRWSPYTYCYNNPMYFVDPDGMEAYNPGDKFKNLRDAAKDFGKEYNGLSISYNLEVGTMFYKSKDESGNEYYSYTVPTVGGEGGVTNDPKTLGKEQEAVADGHTHAGDMDVIKIDGKDFSNNNQFSEPDIDKYENKNNDNEYGKPITGYVATSDGGLREFVPGKNYPPSGIEKANGRPVEGYDVPIAKDLPSDKASGTLRLNQINPCMPAVLPSNFDPNKFKKRDGY